MAVVIVAVLVWIMSTIQVLNNNYNLQRQVDNAVLDNQVTELENEASAGYQIADPVTVTLVADEILTVDIHNDKVTVDVPKTGDDSNLVLWIALMLAGAAGMAGTGIFYFKKVRKSRKTENMQ